MSRPDTKPWREIAAATVAVIVVWAVCVFWLLPANVAVTVSDVGQTLAALVAGVAALIRARLTAQREVRRFWLLLGLAAVSWGAGQGSWTFAEIVLHQELPFPSLADLGFLALPPLACLAMFALPHAAPTRPAKLRSLLDGMLVASSLLLVGWVFVLEAVLANSPSSWFDRIVALAYPVGDIVVITVVVFASMTARRFPPNSVVPYRLVGGGLTLITAADVTFAYAFWTGSYSTGDYVDIGWFAGFLTIFIAAVRPAPSVGDADTRERVAGPSAGYVVPTAAVVLAVTISVVELAQGEGIDMVSAILRTGMLVLLAGRQVLFVRENRNLTRDLEDRVARRTDQLRASGERFEALVAHSSDVVGVVDRAGVFTYLSDSCERVLGIAHDQALGKHFAAIISDAHECALFQEALDSVSSEPEGIRAIAQVWSLGDKRRHVEVTLTNLLENENVRGVVLNVRDVSDRTLLEERLVYQAFHDALTGLANRAMFRDQLDGAFRHGSADRASLSVLFLDLDGFKAVNDTLGHAAGDGILRLVAERVARVVGPDDTLARIGGDEFGIVVHDRPDREYAAALASRIVEAVREPFDLDGREIRLNASVGIAGIEDGVESGDQLLRNADLAMYEAKASPESSYAFFAPAMHENLVNRVRLEADLRRAVESSSFELFYQPLMRLDDISIAAVEALLRWRHPTRGDIDPTEFIPAAESTGLIRQLGLWVMETACVQTAKWQRTIPGCSKLRVTVNVSAKQLHQPDLIERISQVLEVSGLPAGSLTLEMTEGVLMVDTESTLATLQSIRDLGVRLAIDDFGTGYSSLSYLHRFPVDTLKIDRGFVMGLAEGRDETMVMSIIRLAKSLDIETVAEGIERRQDAQLLSRLHCDLGQGFYFAPPMPEADMTELLGGQAATEHERLSS